MYFPVRVLTLLCCGGLLLAIPLGLRQSFGLFLPEFLERYPQGAGHFGIAIALQNLVWGLLSPVFGLFADRYGAAKVAAVGGIGYTLGVLLMSTGLDTPGGLWAGQLLIGMGMSGCGFSVVFGAVARAVPEQQRSMALGVVSAGGSLGQFLGPLLVGYGLVELHWGGTLLLSAAVAVCLIPAAVGLRERRIPDAAQVTMRGWGVRDFVQRDYVLLTSGFFVCGLQVVSIMTHLPTHLVEIGLTKSYAYWSLACIGLFNIPGTLACGWLGDRLRKKNILSVIYLLRSVVVLGIVILPMSGYMALFLSALMGFLWLGTIPLTSALVAHLCGVRQMATFYGVTFLSHQLGSFVGAWMGGVVRSYSGGYDLMWWMIGIAGLVAAALHYPIRETAPRAVHTALS